MVHHTVVSVDLETLRISHLRKGWDDVAYHFVISTDSASADGLVEVTDRWLQQREAPHTRNVALNEVSIAIALVGNFEVERPSPAQLGALRNLMSALLARFDISTERVVAHRDVNATKCPGRNLPLGDLLARWFPARPPPPQSGLADVVLLDTDPSPGHTYPPDQGWRGKALAKAF